MIPGKAKRLVESLIIAYKFRKYRDLFAKALSREERSLLLPVIYFISESDVRTVFDIGAAEGNFSIGAAKLHNIEKVFAFEPLPSAYEKLTKRSRCSEAIKCFNLAVGQHTGKIQFYVAHGGDSSSCLAPNTTYENNFPDRSLVNTIEVDVAMLDDIRRNLDLPYPDLVKIDTQGFEVAVLLGAQECMARAKYCIVECSYAPLYEGSALIGDVFHYFDTRKWKLVGATSQSCDVRGRPLQIDLVFHNEYR